MNNNFTLVFSYPRNCRKIKKSKLDNSGRFSSRSRVPLCKCQSCCSKSLLFYFILFGRQHEMCLCRVRLFKGFSSPKKGKEKPTRTGQRHRSINRYITEFSRSTWPRSRCRRHSQPMNLFLKLLRPLQNISQKRKEEEEDEEEKAAQVGCIFFIACGTQ